VRPADDLRPIIQRQAEGVEARRPSMAHRSGSGGRVQAQPDYRLNRLKGEFCVVWEEGGKRHRYRLGTSDPKEARATLREFIHQRTSVQRLDRVQTIGDCWHAYVAEKQDEGKSVARMHDAWKRLSPRLAAIGGRDLTPNDVRGYTVSRRKSGASDGTIHTELGLLRAALRHSLKQDAPAVPLPPKPRPRERHLTSDEAKRLIDAADMPHVRLFIRLALFTAGRPSSILDLTWDRVDFERGLIRLDNPSRDRTAKGRALVPMAPELRGELRQAEDGALTGHVIEWAGRPIKSIKKAISRVAAKAGVERCTPYVLRKTAAVWMVEAGVPIEEVAQYLGHTTPSITFKVYGRYSPDYLRKASNAISSRLKA
jgi:integrase